MRVRERVYCECCQEGPDEDSPPRSQSAPPPPAPRPPAQAIRTVLRRLDSRSRHPRPPRRDPYHRQRLYRRPYERPIAEHHATARKEKLQNHNKKRKRSNSKNLDRVISSPIRRSVSTPANSSEPPARLERPTEPPPPQPQTHDFHEQEAARGQQSTQQHVRQQQTQEGQGLFQGPNFVQKLHALEEQKRQLRQLMNENQKERQNLQARFEEEAAERGYSSLEKDMYSPLSQNLSRSERHSRHVSFAEPSTRPIRPDGQLTAGEHQKPPTSLPPPQDGATPGVQMLNVMPQFSETQDQFCLRPPPQLASPPPPVHARPEGQTSSLPQLPLANARRVDSIEELSMDFVPGIDHNGTGLARLPQQQPAIPRVPQPGSTQKQPILHLNRDLLKEREAVYQRFRTPAQLPPPQLQLPMPQVGQQQQQTLGLSMHDLRGPLGGQPFQAFQQEQQGPLPIPQVRQQQQETLHLSLHDLRGPSTDQLHLPPRGQIRPLQQQQQQQQPLLCPQVGQQQQPTLHLSSNDLRALPLQPLHPTWVPLPATIGPEVEQAPPQQVHQPSQRLASQGAFVAQPMKTVAVAMPTSCPTAESVETRESRGSHDRSQSAPHCKVKPRSILTTLKEVLTLSPQTSPSRPPPPTATATPASPNRSDPRGEQQKAAGLPDSATKFAASQGTSSARPESILKISSLRRQREQAGPRPKPPKLPRLQSCQEDFPPQGNDERFSSDLRRPTSCPATEAGQIITPTASARFSPIVESPRVHSDVPQEDPMCRRPYGSNSDFSTPVPRPTSCPPTEAGQIITPTASARFSPIMEIPRVHSDVPQEDPMRRRPYASNSDSSTPVPRKKKVTGLEASASTPKTFAPQSSSQLDQDSRDEIQDDHDDLDDSRQGSVGDSLAAPSLLSQTPSPIMHTPRSISPRSSSQTDNPIHEYHYEVNLPYPAPPKPSLRPDEIDLPSSSQESPPTAASSREFTAEVPAERPMKQMMTPVVNIPRCDFMALKTLKVNVERLSDRRVSYDAAPTRFEEETEGQRPPLKQPRQTRAPSTRLERDEGHLPEVHQDQGEAHPVSGPELRRSLRNANRSVKYYEDSSSMSSN